MLVLRVNFACYIPVNQDGMQKASLIQFYFSYPLFVLTRSISGSAHALFGRALWAGLHTGALAEVVAEPLMLLNPWSNFPVIYCTQERLSC